MMDILSFDSIVEAKQILNKKVKRTPLNHSTTFSKMASCEVYLKHENLQKAGSFKVRGAYNKIANIDKSMRERGVVAVSTGNHAQGVALAASLFGISATIVMPKGVPIPKIEATKGYGGTVILHGESFAEAHTKALEIAEKDGLTLIHAFDDQHVAAGQGTIGLEILEDLPEVDLVICPIGGGGLISGIATAIKAQKPSCRIIGVQTEEMSAAYQSIKKGTLITTGKGNTIANGIAIKSPSTFTFSTMKSVLDDVVIVKEEEIAEAILLLLERGKTIAEGAGAVSLAALLNRDIAKKDEKTVLVVSGGNIDITILGKIITQGLIKAGRYHELEVLVEDKPGKLEALLEIITSVEGNVVDIDFDRYSHNIPFGYVGLNIALETKNHLHSKEITEKVKASYRLKSTL
jgi:threonine dehydratase